MPVIPAVVAETTTVVLVVTVGTVALPLVTVPEVAVLVVLVVCEALVCSASFAAETGVVVALELEDVAAEFPYTNKAAPPRRMMMPMTRTAIWLSFIREV